MKIDVVEKSIEEISQATAAKFGVEHSRLLPIIQRMAQLKFPMEFSVHLFNEALSYSSEKAVQLFSSTGDLETLVMVLLLGDNFHVFIPLLLDLKELSVLIEDALNQLHSNKDALITTGFSKIYTGKCSPIDVLVNRLYFVKTPVGMRVSHLPNGYEAVFAWSCSAKIIFKPITLPPYQISQFVGSDFRLFSHNEFGQNITFDTDYSVGQVIDELRDKADWIENWRKKIYIMKVEILERISSALKDGDARTLFIDCITIMAKDLEREDIEKFLKLDSLYSSQHSYSLRPLVKVSSSNLIAQNGGLSELLWLIGHCEFEIESRCISETRRLLGDWVKSHPEMENCLLSMNNEDSDLLENKWIARYIEMSGNEREKFNSIIFQYWSKTSNELDFWRRFGSRLDTAIEGEFVDSIVIKTRGKYKRLVENLVQDCEYRAKLGLSTFNIDEHVVRYSKNNKKAVRTVDVPLNATWEQVTITIKIGEIAELKIKGKPGQSFNYTELGFKNQTTNGPDRNWEMLKCFSKNQGEIIPAEGRIRDCKKRVSDFRKALTLIFQIEGNPVVYNKRTGSYKTRFLIKNELPKDRTAYVAVDDREGE